MKKHFPGEVFNFRENIDASDSSSVEAHRIDIRETVLKIILMSYEESDRSAVIVAAADFDADLERLLTLALLPATSKQDSIFDPDMPLGSFSSKIHFSYRLGIISIEIMRSLELIRKIRNDFAHKIDESFYSEKQRPRLFELVSLVKPSKMYDLCLNILPEKESPKAQFVAATSVIALMMKSGIWSVSRATANRAINIPKDA